MDHIAKRSLFFVCLFSATLILTSRSTPIESRAGFSSKEAKHSTDWAGPSEARWPPQAASRDGASDGVNAMQLTTASSKSAWSAGGWFQDCRECPKMVVIPAGAYTMGDRPSEEERENAPTEFRSGSLLLKDREKYVKIRSDFAVGVYPVTVSEYRSFVTATGRKLGQYQIPVNPLKHVVDVGCRVVEGGAWASRSDLDWENPGFSQADKHPVVCVSWDDAKDYVRWLNALVPGGGYRLLSEAEWEYAARADTGTARYWGDAVEWNNANCGGCGSQWDYKSTSPAGSFRPNDFGLFDMLGDAWQWTEDCWNETIYGQPASGVARASGECGRRILRGGSWTSPTWAVRAGHRFHRSIQYRYNDVGFRVARSLRH